jgi:poly(A) polymerase
MMCIIQKEGLRMFNTESGEFIAATHICKLIQDNGYEAVLAGGCVRDHLLNVPFNDIDIATNADLDYLTSLLNARGIHTKDVGKAFGVMLAQVGDYKFEIARFRKDLNCDGRHPDHVEFCSMQEDALRRDFTINAIFYDPITKNYLNYVGGIEDIRDKRLRFVGNPEDRIKEDYLRILRYVRFVEKGYEPDKDEKQVVERMAKGLLDHVSPERIRMELMDKIFPSMKPIKMFKLFPSVFEAIFPDLYKLKNLSQSPLWHPEGDVYTHTIQVLYYLNNSSSCTPLLILAALFHDFGKLTTTKWQDGDFHSFGHELVSTDMAREWMTKFKFSNEDIEYVTWLVKNHMKLHYPGLKKSSLKRLMSDGDINGLLLLTLADCLGASGDTTEYLKYKERIQAILSGGTDTRPPPKLTGQDLIFAGLKPGPLFKTLLNTAYDHQLEDDSVTKELLLQEALNATRS